jgi:shikimate dehydrogenase
MSNAICDFAVFGHPVTHSLSPEIHAHFAAQLGIAMRYQKHEVSGDQLAKELKRWLAAGGRGLNLTLPHKQQALSLCVELDATATRAQATNTLQRIESERGPGWRGFNTDGIGLVRDLQQRHNVQLSGARMLMLGAGGAAAGVLPALLDAGIAGCWIANRSLQRAENLCAQHPNSNLHALSLDGLDSSLGRFDLLINATAKGHQSEDFLLPDGLIDSASTAYDLSYGMAAMPLLRWACEIECRAFDGLGMLIEQAAEAFSIWHGQRPDTTQIWAELRARTA